MKVHYGKGPKTVLSALPRDQVFLLNGSAHLMTSAGPVHVGGGKVEIEVFCLDDHVVKKVPGDSEIIPQPDAHFTLN